MTIPREDWQAKLNELLERCKDRVLAEMEQELTQILRESSRNTLQEMLVKAGMVGPAEYIAEPVKNMANSADNIVQFPEIVTDSKENLEEEDLEQPFETEPVADPQDAELQDFEMADNEWLWYGVAIIPRNHSFGVIEGMEEHHCEMLTFSELGMAVCKVAQREYGQDPLHEHMSDLKWVEDHARKHEEILVKITEHNNVILPLPFCTLFISPEHVQKELAGNYDYLLNELNRIGSLREMNLKLFVNRENLRMQIVKENPFEGVQGGKSYFERRYWEQDIANQIEQFIAAKCNRLLERMKGITVDRILLEHNLDVELNGMAPILKACFLLAPERLTQFEETLSSFDQETDDYGFMADISGPWPPFHFVRLQGDGVNE